MHVRPNSDVFKPHVFIIIIRQLFSRRCSHISPAPVDSFLWVGGACKSAREALAKTCFHAVYKDLVLRWGRMAQAIYPRKKLGGFASDPVVFIVWSKPSSHAIVISYVWQACHPRGLSLWAFQGETPSIRMTISLLLKPWSAGCWLPTIPPRLCWSTENSRSCCERA